MTASMSMHFMTSRVLILLMVAIVSAGCGGGGGSSSRSVSGSPAEVLAPELNGPSPSSLSETIDDGASVDRSISFSNSGNATLSYSATTSADWITFLDQSSGSLIAGGDATVRVRIDCTAGTQDGSITLGTNDTDKENVTISVSVTCIPVPVNHVIARVMLNQASRSYDSDLGADMLVSTIAGRDLLVRVLATGAGNVPAGEVVVTTQSSEARFPLVMPPSLSETEPDESLLAGGHYAVVPGSALQASSTMHVELSGVRYPEMGMIDLKVEDPGRQGITLVPVTFDGQTPVLDPDVYLRQALQQLPLGEYDVSVRAPYSFDAAYDLDVLLDEVNDLRTMDGSPDLYHAVIIPPDQSGTQTGGLAYIGFPVSVSIDLGGTQNVVAHEIGHNFDLRHAPACEAPNPDPSYPDPDGQITNWGYDVVGQRLVDPTNKKDLMSYCSDVWISRYSFAKALDYRLSDTASSGSGARALITFRGRINQSGVEALSALPGGRIASVEQAHTHTFRAWSRGGQLLIDAGFTPMDVAHGRVGEQVFVVTTDVPAETIYSYVVSGPAGVLHEAVAQPADPAIELTRQSSGREIRWQPGPGHTLVVRNARGEVIGLSQRETVRLPSTAASVEIRGLTHLNDTLTPFMLEILD